MRLRNQIDCTAARRRRSPRKGRMSLEILEPRQLLVRGPRVFSRDLFTTAPTTRSVERLSSFSTAPAVRCSTRRQPTQPVTTISTISLTAGVTYNLVTPDSPPPASVFRPRSTMPLTTRRSPATPTRSGHCRGPEHTVLRSQLDGGFAVADCRFTAQRIVLTTRPSPSENSGLGPVGQFEASLSGNLGNVHSIYTFCSDELPWGLRRTRLSPFSPA